MKELLRHLRSALITGLVVVLPAWLAILLFLKALVKLGVIVKPISGHLPETIDHPRVIGAFLFLVICLLAGTLFHTAIGRIAGAAIEASLLNKIPGYGSIKNIAQQVSDFESEKGFKPALIEIEDQSLSPAFLIEAHADGRSTVFMPSVPTPMAGAVLIMDSSRVHPVNVPVTTMMKCISKWGTGTSELLAAMQLAQPAQPVNPNP